MKSDREKKFGNAWKYALLPILLGLLAEIENAGVLIFVVVLALLGGGLGWLIRKELKRGNSKREAPTAQGKRMEALVKQVKARRRAAEREVEDEQRTAFSAKNFDLEEYDRRKRLKQLDVFLHNGIIDKAEYRKLKERYEKV